MIKALPSVMRLWPDARVVFVKRRGIENVVSRLKKFPDVPFESHCRQWRNCMRAWEQVRDAVPHRLELDQFDVQHRPDKAAASLAEFLTLSAGQQDLLTQCFARDRPELQFRIECSPDLSPGSWVELPTTTSPLDALTELLEAADGAAGGQRFYRLVIRGGI